MKNYTACLSLALAVLSFNAGAAPYSGTAVPLPATIEAEHFDKGGEGVGYHDLSSANTGRQFRSDEAVDIIADAAGSGGYVVNNFRAGEWLAYTVNAPAAGTYNLSLRASNNYWFTPAFHIEVDGAKATGSVTVPKTGSWNNFRWVAAPAIKLGAGQHTIRVVADVPYFNLDQVRIEVGALEPPPDAGGSAGTPYSGTPVALPGVFEAEDFDKGGEGVAYHDRSAGNSGGQYRTGESVDIIASSDAAGGRYVVNNFQRGEWLAYTVNVPASGKYDLAIRAAHNYWSTPAFHIEVDGVNVTGQIAVPKTGSWSAFQWVGKDGVDLAAGKHVLKLVADAEYFNVNQLRVSASAVTPPPGETYSGTPYTGTPIPLPRMFEAEDFDRGGEGVAYHDVSARNTGGEYRTSESVDIIPSYDAAGGGYSINDFRTGEWLAYTVNVPESGKYDLSVRVASNDGTPALHIEVDGVNVTGTIAVPRTGGWDRFQWVGKAGVALAAGRRVLKLVADGEYFTANQISVLAAAEAPPPATVAEPAPIRGKGYRLVKNWDFVQGIRSISALQSEFYPFYIYANGTLSYLGEEWQRYRDFSNGNHVFTSQGLALRAFLKSGRSLAAGNIDSGMLRSKWTGKYGYYEVRMKVPGGRGLWPAFWLNPQDQTWPPEIDVLEIVNNGRDTTQNSFHFVHGAGTQGTTFSLLDQWGSYRPGFDYKDGFHTFAVEWTPERVRHYVDDKLVVERSYKWMHDNGSDGGPAHVLLNLAVGGTWPGAPSSSSLPADLLVQYVRVWQQ